MGIMIGLLLLSCLVIVLCGARGPWQRRSCPACRSSNPARATRCAYCTSLLPQPMERV